MNSESKRLKQLRKYQILDTPNDTELDRITQLASRIFNAPICAISLVDEDRQWFKSRVGLSICETSREVSFCSHAIDSPTDLFVVKDARNDDRFKSNPLVVDEPKIVFYAGAKLTDSDGYTLGTLCLIDTVAREFDLNDRSIFKDLASTCMFVIENKYKNSSFEQDRYLAKIILDNDPSFIWLKDKCNNIIFSNKAAANAIGESPNSLSDKNTSDYYPEYADDFYKDDLEVINTKRPKLNIVEKFYTNGSYVDIETCKYPVFDENGQVSSVLVISRDISEEKKLSDALIELTNLQNSILNSTNMSIISTDRTGIVKIYNKEAEVMFGIPCSNVIGNITVVELLGDKYLREYFNLNDDTDLFSHLTAKSREGIAETNEFRFFNSKNESIEILITTTVVLNKDGNIEGYLFVSKDVSNLKDALKEKLELEQRIAEARLAVKQKTEFLANISHEVRTPLTSIVSLSELLLDTNLNEEQYEDAIGIYESSKSMSKLLGTVFDFSKIEAGSLSLIENNIITSEFLRHIQLDFEKLIEHKNQIPHYSVIGRVPDEVYLDVNRVYQILNHLIDNASKFSAERKIVKLEIEFNKNTLRFSVTDLGVGISEAIKDRIFKPYMQGDSSTKKEYSGLGLGLAMSSELAKLMHGSITYKSVVGEGSTFSFELPLQSKDIESIDLEILKNKKVLIAEDNIVNRIVLNRVLQSAGIVVTEAVDGVEVFQKLKHDTFDLILLDIHMPNMDGIQVLEELKKLEDFNTPVAMLTACVTKNEKDLTESLGSRAFFTKPIERDELFKGLAKILISG